MHWRDLKIFPFVIKQVFSLAIRGKLPANWQDLKMFPHETNEIIGEARRSELFPDCWVFEKDALKSPIPLSWYSAEVLAELEQRATAIAHSLGPSNVLLACMLPTRRPSTYVKLDGFGAALNSIHGNEIEYGRTNRLYDWRELCVAAVQFFERHQSVFKARQLLSQADIKTHWTSYHEHQLVSVDIGCEITDNTVETLRRLAKQQLGITEEIQSSRFEHLLKFRMLQITNLAWSRKYRTVKWPPTKDDIDETSEFARFDLPDLPEFSEVVQTSINLPDQSRHK